MLLHERDTLPAGIPPAGSFLFRLSLAHWRQTAIFAKRKSLFMIAESKTLQLIMDKAEEILPRGARLLLFCSRARNTAREDSDWDLLIILNKPRRSVSDIEMYACPFMELGFENNAEINPVIYTKTEWGKRKFTMFHHNVEKEGVDIWH